MGKYSSTCDFCGTVVGDFYEEEESCFNFNSEFSLEACAGCRKGARELLIPDYTDVAFFIVVSLYGVHSRVSNIEEAFQGLYKAVYVASRDEVPEEKFYTTRASDMLKLLVRQHKCPAFLTKEDAKEYLDKLSERWEPEWKPTNDFIDFYKKSTKDIVNRRIRTIESLRYLL